MKRNNRFWVVMDNTPEAWIYKTYKPVRDDCSGGWKKNADKYQEQIPLDVFSKERFVSDNVKELLFLKDEIPIELAILDVLGNNLGDITSESIQNMIVDFLGAIHGAPNIIPSITFIPSHVYWTAKDKDGAVWIYPQKPRKAVKSVYGPRWEPEIELGKVEPNPYCLKNGNFFPGLSWDDKEPTGIILFDKDDEDMISAALSHIVDHLDTFNDKERRVITEFIKKVKTFQV